VFYAVLAGAVGAIPFVGPYWISLPAILELWLIESRPLSAVALLIFSLLPALFVDNLINGEIEG
jgi:predicted PurR-regulated permease PerM